MNLSAYNPARWWSRNMLHEPGWYMERLRPTQITESTFNRLLHHLRDDETGFAIVSADRSDRDPDPQGNAAANNKKRAEALQLFRQYAPWALKVHGVWVETTKDGDKRRVAEQSFVLPGVSLEDAKSLAQLARTDLGQQSILWGRLAGPAETRGVFLVSPEGVEQIGSTLAVRSMADLYTARKAPDRKTYPQGPGPADPPKISFESLTYEPVGFTDTMGWSLELRKTYQRHVAESSA